MRDAKMGIHGAQSASCFAGTTSAIDAISDAAEDVFDLSHTGVCVELVERAATAEGAIGSLEPSGGFVSAP
jgi:uncharacterized protein with PhoU and TrkA domain